MNGTESDEWSSYLSVWEGGKQGCLAGTGLLKGDDPTSRQADHRRAPRMLDERVLRQLDTWRPGERLPRRRVPVLGVTPGSPWGPASR